MTPTPILLLGFEPFGGDTINPAKEILTSCDLRIFPSQIHIAILPVDHQHVAQNLPRLLETHQPQLVIGWGLAAGESSLRLERVGLNWLDFSIPDASGQQIRDQRLSPEAPDAYISDLPLRTAQNHLAKHGIPSVLSYTAGTYLCNQLLFTCLDFFAQRNAPRNACFVHLPLLPEMIATRQALRSPLPPSLSLSTLQAALPLLVNTLWNGVCALSSPED